MSLDCRSVSGLGSFAERADLRHAQQTPRFGKAPQRRLSHWPCLCTKCTTRQPINPRMPRQFNQSLTVHDPRMPRPPVRRSTSCCTRFRNSGSPIVGRSSIPKSAAVKTATSFLTSWMLLPPELGCSGAPNVEAQQHTASLAQ